MSTLEIRKIQAQLQRVEKAIQTTEKIHENMTPAPGGEGYSASIVKQIEQFFTRVHTRSRSPSKK